MQLQPEFFVEIPEELAREKGIANGDRVRVTSARGSIEGRAMVTRRIKPMQVGGRTTHQIGFPIHWGFLGRGTAARVARESRDADDCRSQLVHARVQGVSREAGEGVIHVANTLELLRVSAHSAPAPGVRQLPSSRSSSTPPRASAARRAKWRVRNGTTCRRRRRCRWARTRRCPTSAPNFWNLIKFNEHEDAAGLHWLMRKDQCMHCAEPGCLVACPAPGAIVQYTNGIVDFQQDHCIGCGYCMTGCPFNVPKFNPETKRVYKCTMCVDRTSVGLQPACVKACPTSCLQFGTKDAMLEVANTRVEQLKANGFRECCGLRSAGCRRDVGRHGARVRRPAGAVRTAAKSRRSRWP